jgi:hypothetical protein
VTRPTWNDIQNRAALFSAKWDGESYERGESQSFWSDFLDVFGIDRRRHGGYFEYAVKIDAHRRGFIDMFLPGKLLAEQKSRGRDLNRAKLQALDYLPGIPDPQLPQAIIVCDFQTFQVMNLITRDVVEFDLDNFHKHVKLFAFLLDEEASNIIEESPVNRAAAEAMALLHEQLDGSGYRGHKLELLLVRLVFCHFADDARIFEKGAFETFIKNRTTADGSNLGPLLGKVFEVLNTPPNERNHTLDSDLAALPYINGGLFAETTVMPDFDREMRETLLATATPDWSVVSPAIFGSMFQGVMSDVERHELGAHYTSEKNILRVIQPLFLDALYVEFDKVRKSPKQLASFHEKLARLSFMDPACGCGNFLVITYRELRRLEHRVVDALQKGMVTLTDVRDLLKVRVEQMYGIEIEEFPALIARTALWLTDLQMNLEAGARFGQQYTRIPLTEGAHIHNANALTTPWNDIVPAAELDFILGNPPFNGSRTMVREQKEQVRAVARGIREAGLLDYVAAWYLLAAEYTAANPAIQVAFVSTNSISQGEQPGIIWERLFALGCTINFAHRTFRWSNDARGVAAVHCVVIGFSRTAVKPKQIYSYIDIGGEPVLTIVDRINPYLVDGADTLVRNRQKPISAVPRMSFGNMPADGGNLILSPAERDELLAEDPTAAPYVLPLIGAAEFINGKMRYCLWLEGVSAGAVRSHPQVFERVQKTREVRLVSARPKLADVSSLFAQITQRPDVPFLLVPRHSSENREYVPMGFFPAGNVGHDSCLVIPDADPFHFAVLTSRMHMAWLRAVGGRLKSDYRYSKDIVYNNFVWPASTEAQRLALATGARAILDARAVEPDSTLADLYDPAAMPGSLRKAHHAVDAAVDRLYRMKPFDDDVQRVAHLLELHRETTSS